MSRSIAVALVFAIGLVSALFVSSPAIEAAKPVTWAGRLVIDNPGGSERVLHDCINQEGNTECSYTDYRLPNGDTCVMSQMPAAGLAFMELNRRDNFATLNWCSEQTDSAGNNLGYQARRYTLRIANLAVCQWLNLAAEYYANAVGHPEGWCDVTTPATPQPRVRGETVFKSKATKTHVNFIFSWEGRMYHVLTDREAPITGTSNSKTVTYDGTATISSIDNSLTPTSFYLPFTLRFEREPL